ncbi:MAG: UDP-N-acetylmuramoyl-L-alanyl-D-glutamate--2,6-diaminopimelate ligase [Clostridiales Family XIII bacterium]|jgi:UDP-N-acetylmuramoyl-L-alanyl-D-glutamate--2,6-diaminopimelate ligase|nr:UDP-N-acetylmuramoyl-L-alanyl-D-glutamate--2,6-diaminopimelate ligase [Clostridiales Family XIII bacterium]
MKLRDILPEDTKILVSDDLDVEVLGISYDSRTVQNGYVFFALPGHSTDGNKYIDEAIKKGASVIVSHSKVEVGLACLIIAEDIFRFMSTFSAKFYNYPDRDLNVIGITGTNGKTTISYMIDDIFTYIGIDCGVMGTINYRYKDKVIEAQNTTPQAPDIYRIMREMLNVGVKHIVMEISSHALSLGRVYGIDFDIAVFTNLTQDHLDFHKTMGDYFEAKASLFRSLGTGSKKNLKFAVININDKYGKKLVDIGLNAEKRLYCASDNTKADFKAINIDISSSGSKFDLVYAGKTAKINIKHLGLHNVYNALAALSACVCSGIDFHKAIEGLNNARQAPGRLERVDTGSLGFEILVDYAHTEDALKNVLEAIKKIKHKRIITVFGCGGDRDRSKRPKMGKTAVEMSNFVFVTSDNPRTEDPNLIILDIEAGIRKIYKTNYKVVVERQEAIKEAIVMADKGDIVLLAGKGHETYQVVGLNKIHFSDIETAKKYIALKNRNESISNTPKQEEFNF